ncbi:nucleotidyltransferase-like protein [Ferviditalea candida]|uniref:Nucleotidyltransferase-like protein n=1 Tax=Ferviditalea candida TaxID=3108399 RepID=A0ABU5ZJW1_9BACL|nr:nucleotidyltransferase-like protein [Paenibacillaceae bacterium T2]
MDKIKNYVSRRYRNDHRIRSVLIVQTVGPFSPVIDGFDILLLIVSDDLSRKDFTTHYIKEGSRVQERWVNAEGLELWVLSGDNRSIIQWILQGDIILDRGDYLDKMKHRLLEFPLALREQKLLIEFSMFLRKYLLSKDYLREGQIFDAYSNVLEALFHWAHLAIIEAGYHPEVTVWQQIHRINAGVYKLYEELALSRETIEQRIELVLLACEFSVMAKMGKYCALLIRIMNSRSEPWTPMELVEHPELKGLHIEMVLVLHNLVKRHLIKEVAVADTEDIDHIQLKYSC